MHGLAKTWDPRAFQRALFERGWTVKLFYRAYVERFGRARGIGYGMFTGWARAGSWREYAWPAPRALHGRIARVLGVRVEDLVR